VLVRVRMATICRSDIHSWQGLRPNPCPGVLGHEIVGEIVALGEGVTVDMRGEALAVGERITWSEYFVAGRSYFSDVLDLPHKTPGVCKYGHLAVEREPHHHGGFGEYCYIQPQSWILRVPAPLSDAEAAPLNCGVATMIAVAAAADIGLGDSVVIQGLGLLGLYAAAIARTRGARRVIGIDPLGSRRDRALLFGVDVALDPHQLSGDELAREVQALCRPAGADVVVEVCGDAQVIPAGMAMLRVGGVYVVAGVVNPRSEVVIDANLLLGKLLTLRGVHNYHPRDLIAALDFVVAQRRQFPFSALVDGRYALDEVGAAMADAAAGRVLRAAIVP
jgi:putative phosphonate catabolism associated alcohol dehydrogenase